MESVVRAGQLFDGIAYVYLQLRKTSERSLASNRFSS